MKTLTNLLLTLLLFAGCAKKEQLILHDDSINFLVKEVKPYQVTLKDFDSKYFMPWSISAINLDIKTASWANNHFNKKDRYYGEDIKPWSKTEIEKVIKKTNFNAYNREDFYAITTRNEQIRELPTNKPFFKKTNLPGEGYPFDYLQNSRIHINTPLLVSHFSTDGSWAFAKNPFSIGWIPSGSLVKVSKKQKKSFEIAKKIVILKDNTPIYTQKQRYVTKVKLGAVFPYIKEDKSFYYSYLFINTLENFGKKVEVVITKNSASLMPLSFSKDNVLRVSKNLLGQKYGWGGYLGNRDCSAMTKDFFATFGVWLPRNSAAQKSVGVYLSLKGLSAKEKEEKIVKNGIAFLSLIYFKGHIMLYIGERDGRAMVLHDIWGLRVKNDGKESRHVIGKTVISDLYLGENLSNLHANSLLINKIDGIMIKPDIIR